MQLFLDIIRAHPIVAFCCGAAYFSGDLLYLLVPIAVSCGAFGMYWVVVYQNATGSADNLLKVLRTGGRSARIVKRDFPVFHLPGVQFISVVGSARAMDQAVAMDLRFFGKVIAVPPSYAQAKDIHKFVIAHELRHVSRAQSLHDLSINLGWIALLPMLPAISIVSSQYLFVLSLFFISRGWHGFRCSTNHFSMAREVDADIAGLFSFPPEKRAELSRKVAALWRMFARSADSNEARRHKAEEWRIRASALEAAGTGTFRGLRDYPVPVLYHPVVDSLLCIVLGVFFGAMAEPMGWHGLFWVCHFAIIGFGLQIFAERQKFSRRRDELIGYGLQPMSGKLACSQKPERSTKTGSE
ncbi:hypothetical protein [Chiayiivirga flava]|uniref:Uncharacterized protein n=1 Tax=Chiayiivirga flava TaxID=659595 RepID=A0A7W8D807_9GAMM|nr:hypothetical protein [Chiayiivirga flava]MBB5208366.1 hypothetical protein [Chiayiivirga flava]